MKKIPPQYSALITAVMSAVITGTVVFLSEAHNRKESSLLGGTPIVTLFIYCYLYFNNNPIVWKEQILYSSLTNIFFLLFVFGAAGTMSLIEYTEPKTKELTKFVTSMFVGVVLFLICVVFYWYFVPETIV